jgi:Uma2 family endonuclease
VARLNRWLVRGLPGDAHTVRIGSPVTMRPLSEPQPDFAVVDAGDSTWTAHPERAHLLVEVSMSSLRKDRVRKARIYAEHSIPRYWIVDLVHLCVLVHTDPGPEGYGSVETVRPPALLDPGTCGLPPVDLGALLAA